MKAIDCKLRVRFSEIRGGIVVGKERNRMESVLKQTKGTMKKVMEARKKTVGAKIATGYAALAPPPLRTNQGTKVSPIRPSIAVSALICSSVKLRG